MERCIICKSEFVSDGLSTGYGSDPHGHKICVNCCSLLDARNLEKTGKMTGYLTYKQESIPYRKTGFIDISDGFFTNWPGTFKIPVYMVKKSFNNFGALRLDFWVDWKGKEYHGTQIRENTQIATLKRNKGRSK
mgnify:CR=1 FL=1